MRDSENDLVIEMLDYLEQFREQVADSDLRDSLVHELTDLVDDFTDRIRHMVNDD